MIKINHCFKQKNKLPVGGVMLMMSA